MFWFSPQQEEGRAGAYKYPALTQEQKELSNGRTSENPGNGRLGPHVPDTHQMQKDIEKEISLSRVGRLIKLGAIMLRMLEEFEASMG